MKKANIKAFNETYNGFVLIESISDLIDFNHEKTHGIMKESAVNIVKRLQNKEIKPTNDVITHAVETIHKIKPKGQIFLEAEIMGTYMNDLHKIISNGEKIAINPFNLVSYFSIPKNAEIEIISEKETYSLDDIRISRWPNGAHWYAKIGYIDVVIDGECKWNAKWVAQKKAEEFLQELLLK